MLHCAARVQCRVCECLLPCSLPSFPKPHYLSNVECIPPQLQTQLELEFNQVGKWAISQLRSAIWEAEMAVTQANRTAARKSVEGESPYSQGVKDADRHTV